MKTIYLDKDYMCHLTNNGTMQEVETNIFDGTANGAIPFYRYIPADTEWVDAKGTVFHGLFIQATDSNAIDRAIRQALIDDMQAALDILGVTE